MRTVTIQAPGQTPEREALEDRLTAAFKRGEVFDVVYWRGLYGETEGYKVRELDPEDGGGRLLVRYRKRPVWGETRRVLAELEPEDVSQCQSHAATSSAVSAA